MTWLIYLYEPPIFTIVFGFLVYKWLRVSFGMMGKLCITLSFNAFYIWSVELYPTVVRYISNSFGKSENITRILQWNLCLYLVFTKVPIINWNNKKKSFLTFQFTGSEQMDFWIIWDQLYSHVWLCYFKTTYEPFFATKPFYFSLFILFNSHFPGYINLVHQKNERHCSV